MEGAPIARNIYMFATYTTMDGDSQVTPEVVPTEPQPTIEEWVAERSIAEIKALVANGTLTAEEVYAAEKDGKQRKVLLALYEPKSEPTEGLAATAE